MKSTRKQVVLLCEKLGYTFNESNNEDYDVQIEAPKDCSFGEFHEICLFWYNGGNKSEFWADVIESINELEVHSCKSGQRCLVEGGSVCEWWV